MLLLKKCKSVFRQDEPDLRVSYDLTNHSNI